ncbi:DNA replication factor, partial [Globisporangium splendens]
MEMEPANAPPATEAASPPEPSSPRRDDAKSSQVEQPPPVHMPERLRLLITLFSALEFGLNSLSLYQHTPDFGAVKRAVEGSSQSTFTMDHLQQILYLLPDAYAFASKKGKQQDQPPVLTIRKRRLPGVDAIHDTLTDRIDAFTKKVGAFLRDHVAHIKAADPEITDEMVEKELEKIELERAPVPEVKDVQQIKAKQALDAVKNVDKNVSEQDMKVVLEAPVPEDLKTLPTWLIEKVRTAHMFSGAPSGASVEEIEREKRKSATRAADLDFADAERPAPVVLDREAQDDLPHAGPDHEPHTRTHSRYGLVCCGSIKIFVRIGMTGFLVNAYLVGKIEEQIHLLESMVPFWITVVCSDGKEYVKLSRTHKYNVVKSTLKKCIATSS